MDEFGFIARYLAPLATDRGALGLKDDAALVSCSPGHQLVVTKDALTEGVHFLPKTDPKLLAKKLLRVNLSDMAAMGAVPLYYLIAAILPEKTNQKWWQTFAKGLEEDQEAYGVSLLGGDTVKGRGPLTLSLTMLGEVKIGKALKRFGAKLGDDIYVSGTIGDAALGLALLEGKIKAVPKVKKPLILRYHTPMPRLELGKALYGIASAAVDISDGLLADIGHLCALAGVGAVIEEAAIPLSRRARQLIEKEGISVENILAAGDDYELAFTAAPRHALVLRTLSKRLPLPITKIGTITAKKGIMVRTPDGKDRFPKRLGYTHF